MRGGVELDGESFDCGRWRIEWARELLAFTVQAVGHEQAVVFEDLDEIETAIGAFLPWFLRARLETEQYLALEEQVGSRHHRRRHRTRPVLVARRGDDVAPLRRSMRRRSGR